MDDTEINLGKDIPTYTDNSENCFYKLSYAQIIQFNMYYSNSTYTTDHSDEWADMLIDNINET